jgi:hypothetical protein
MKKIIGAVTLAVLLSGCYMQLPEYQARVNYCTAQGAAAVVYRDSSGHAYRVSCSKNGVLFSTPARIQ